MRRCEDVKMRRCEDVRMWRCEDVRMWGCEGEKIYEDVRMWKWEDVKMWGPVRMWGWADVKIWRCFVKMWSCENVWQTPTIRRTLRSDALGNKTKKQQKTSWFKLIQFDATVQIAKSPLMYGRKMIEPSGKWMYGLTQGRVAICLPWSLGPGTGTIQTSSFIRTTSSETFGRKSPTSMLLSMGFLQSGQFLCGLKRGLVQTVSLRTGPAACAFAQASSRGL